MDKEISAWIIIDDITGNANQAIAVAKAMNINYEIKTLKYNFLSFLPNWLKFNSFIGINLNSSSNLNFPYPDIIISSGRKTAIVSASIKKNNPKNFNIHLMNPDLPFKNFDLVCLPHHDKSPKYEKFNNIHYTIGAPSYLDKTKLQDEAIKFQDKFSSLSKPFMGILIGGATKTGDYPLKELENLVQKADELATNINASLLITTSRRTNPDFAAKLLEKIKSPFFFYDWHRMKLEHNPYSAFLKLRDYFIITGDSVSICSEALSTGKPTYIYRKDNLLSKKHRKFLDYLDKLGYIQYLNNKTDILNKWEYPPLQEAQKISLLIKEKLKDANITITG